MTAPVGVSLDLLDALHKRWLILLGVMVPEDFERRWTSLDFGGAECGCATPALRMAREAPCGAYHGAQEKGGVVGLLIVPRAMIGR